MHAVLVHVIDKGIGIPDMPQEQLFRMFVRASERSETGGIGLYLAKLSATRIFGKLSYAKNEQGHTVFSLLLHPNLQQRLDQVQRLREEKSKQEALIRARMQALSDEVL
jgi:K+-sensing histidine kinase KdpD